GERERARSRGRADAARGLRLRAGRPAGASHRVCRARGAAGAHRAAVAEGAGTAEAYRQRPLLYDAAPGLRPLQPAIERAAVSAAGGARTQAAFGPEAGAPGD